MFRVRIRAVLFVLFLFLNVLLLSNGTVSAVDSETIVKKWEFAQYYSCLKSGDLNQIIVPQPTGPVQNSVFNGRAFVALPSFSFGNIAEDKSEIDCRSLFTGGALEKGIMQFANLDGAFWNDADGARSFLGKVGYEWLTDGSDQFTIGMRHKVTHDDYVLTDEIVFSDVVKYDSKEKEYKIESGSITKPLVLEMGWDRETGLRQLVIKIKSCVEGESLLTRYFTLEGGIDDIKQKIEEELSQVELSQTCENKYRVPITDVFSFKKDESIGYTTIVDSGSIKFNEKPEDVVKKLSGMTVSELQLKPDEKYTLYMYYLDKSLPGGVNNRVTCYPSSESGLTKVKMKDSIDGKVKTCYVNFDGTKPKDIKANIQEEQSGIPVIKSGTMEDVINWLNDNANDDDLQDVPGIVEDIQPTDKKPTCMNTGAMGSLGWVACTVLDTLASGVGGIYTDYIEPALKIDPRVFMDYDDGMSQAWLVFQRFANIVFIVLFLMVIFSQLTGWGIDNYGIKKILPKLIVAAILINLSYLICILCIDLSNIIGNGIKSLFDGLAGSLQVVDSLRINGVNLSLANATTGNFATGLVAVVIVGVLSMEIWSAASNGGGFEAIAITFVLAVIGVFIGIFFLFLLLGAREAAVVALTVISPLAFACIILPNTKKMFDKWLKIGEGLLLLYPVCGLMIGAGNYVSKLLLSTGVGAQGFFPALMAMIVGVVPIFFIPYVLKSSFQAMGNLGAKISGISNTVGNRLKGDVEKTWKESAGYKERSQVRSERQALNRAKRTEAWLKFKSHGDASKLSTRDQRRLTNAYKTIEDDRASKIRAAYYTSPGAVKSRQEQLEASISNEMKRIHSERFDLRKADDVANEFAEAIKGNSDEDIERADAAFESLLGSGDVDKVFKVLGRYNIEGADSRMRDRLFRRASKSGNVLLKGWQKYYGSKDESGNIYYQNLNDFISSGRFNDYLLTQTGANGLDNADKETLEYLKGVLAPDGGTNNEESGERSSGKLDPEVIANILMSSANSNARSTKASVALMDGQLKGIVKKLKVEDLANMNIKVAEAFAESEDAEVKNALKGLIGEILKPENAPLLSKVKGDVRNTLKFDQIQQEMQEQAKTQAAGDQDQIREIANQVRNIAGSIRDQTAGRPGNATGLTQEDVATLREALGTIRHQNATILDSQSGHHRTIMPNFRNKGKTAFEKALMAGELGSGGRQNSGRGNGNPSNNN